MSASGSDSSTEGYSQMDEGLIKTAKIKIDNVTSSKNFQFLLLLLFESYQAIIIIIYFSSMSWLVELQYIIMNRFMWIYLILELFAFMLWLFLFMKMDSKGKIPMLGSYILIGVQILCVGFIGTYVIYGAIDTSDKWGNPVIFVDGRHKTFQILYLVFMGINFFVTIVELLFIVWFFKNLTRWGKILQYAGIVATAKEMDEYGTGTGSKYLEDKKIDESTIKNMEV